MNALATDPHLRPLWQAVHDRLCRGGATARTTVTVADAGPDVRRAVDRLLGRVSNAGKLRVTLSSLDAALARAGTDAATLAVAVAGPIVDRSAVRAAEAAAAADAWTAIFDHPAAGEPALADWLRGIRAAGRLARAGGTDVLLAALDVLGVLPIDGAPVGRPVLAAAVLGGEHDLDDNAPVGRLVTAGLAARAGTAPPATSTGRAALWAAAGVTFDAVSAPALTLGLRPLPVGPLTEAAARWADGGIALPIPAAALVAERWALPANDVVSVCENPSVLEAAAVKLGAACPPLVCVSGMPGRAVTGLLTQLSAGGAQLRYHGDFGTGGITIANLVVARHAATPWQMTAMDHRRALGRVRETGRAPTRLRGRVPAASWDAALTPAIVACGLEITEEHVLDDLLADLAAM